MVRRQMRKLFISLCIIFSAITSRYGLAESTLFESIKNTLKQYGSQGVSGIAKDLGIAYGILMGGVIIHEHTHSLLVRLLYGVPCDTFIGQSNEPLSHPKEYTGVLHLVSPLPFDAHHYYDKDKVMKTPLKELIIALGGPVLATLANFVCLRQLLKSTQSHEYLISKIVTFAALVGHIYAEIPGPITCYGEEMKNDGARAVDAIKALWYAK